MKFPEQDPGKHSLLLTFQTGELLVEKKFYKADFGEVMNNPEYSTYVDTLLESAMVRKMSSEEGVDIDPDSYEEIKSVALQLGDDVFDPEE